MKNLKNTLIGGIALCSLAGLVYSFSLHEDENNPTQKKYEVIRFVNGEMTTNDTIVDINSNYTEQDYLEDLGFSNDENITTQIFMNSNENNEFKVVSDFDSLYGENEIFIEQVSDSTDINDSITVIQIKHEINKAENIFDKIKLELSASKKDSRLDSLQFSKLLQMEFRINNIQPPIDWAVFDKKNNAYVIQPKRSSNFDYNIPLFTNDIISPGNFELKLNFNNQKIIWGEIKVMIVLSFLFLIIMASVFGYSIKLALKHKKISQIKSDFINNMTHEFKTPLATISLASDSILHPNTNYNPESIKAYVKTIKNEQHKLNDYVERILEVASLNKNALEITIESIDLKSTIINAINKLNLIIKKKNVTIIFERKHECYILGNRFHLENVIVNLIENAIKYTDSLAKIDLSIEETFNSFILNISDSGIGMSKQQISKAFDVFYRAQTGNIHDTKGFGLGLSYCKLVIEKMGGTIELISEINKGTTVKITLNKHDTKS